MVVLFSCVGFMVDWCCCVLVLLVVWVWCGFVFFFATSLLLPHSPSVPSTFFYPSLKITYQTQSFGAGISENDEK